MKNNRQYLIVGLFVIIASAILIAIWLWFSASNRQNYDVYLTIFHEPIDGISTSSVVKYNGVEIGKVKQIELDDADQHNVFVYLNILQKYSINQGTYATIRSQGITGLSYIGLYLDKSSTSKKNIVPHNSPPYPEITTRLSLLYSLSEQAQSVTNNINDISVQVKNALNEQNIQHLNNILRNLDQVSSTIANRSKDIEQSMDLVTKVLVNVKKNSEQLNSTFKNINTLTNNLSKTSQNANDLITNVQNNTLQNINSVLLPNLNHTITNLNQSSYQLAQFLTLLNENPAALIRGKIPAKPGPGE